MTIKPVRGAATPTAATTTPQDEANRSAAAGAEAFIGLLRGMQVHAESSFDAANARGEPEAQDQRDYVALAAMVQDSLFGFGECQSPTWRTGFLLAMTDLLTVAADGCVVDIDTWAPLQTTAPCLAANPGRLGRVQAAPSPVSAGHA